MDDYYLPLSLTSHLLITPLGVDCKFAVLNNNNNNNNKKNPKHNLYISNLYYCASFQGPV